jgi:hypothetical protein
VIAILLIYRLSSASGLTIWGVLGMCLGIYLFIRGFRLLQQRRLILDTPFSKIRSASMGMVEVSGLAVGPYTVVAPITERSCYYYRTLVWEWKQSGKNKQWVKVAGECVHVPFFVDDNSGRVLVDPRGADLDLHCDFEGTYCDSFFTTQEATPPNVLKFLANHGVVTNDKIKVEECCIKPKNSLFILGTLADNPGIEVSPQAVRDDGALDPPSVGLSLGTGRLRFSADVGGVNFGSVSFSSQRTMQPADAAVMARTSVERAAVKSTDMSQQQKIAAALLRAGITRPAAWGAAGLVHSEVAVNTDPSLAGVSGSNPDDVLTRAGFDPHPPVVLTKGSNDKTFMISWRSQQAIARSLGWKCTLMIWGGPILALVSLYILIGIVNNL